MGHFGLGGAGPAGLLLPKQGVLRCPGAHASDLLFHPVFTCHRPGQVPWAAPNLHSPQGPGQTSSSSLFPHALPTAAARIPAMLRSSL